MNWLKVYIAPSILVGVALAVPVAAEDVVRLDAASMNRAGVLVRPVLERSFGEQIMMFGEVVRSPGTTWTVKTPVHGRVLEVFLTPGELAVAGEPLLAIHSHDVHELEGQLLRRHELLRLARSRLQAGEELYDLEGISRVELEQRAQRVMAEEIEYGQVEHELEDVGFRAADFAALRERRQPSGQLTIRAPADGVIFESTVQQYDWLQDLDSLMVLGDPDELELEIKIQPSDATRVGYGDVVEFVPVGRTRAAGRARVLTPIPRVDPVTRTVTVRAEILETGESLFPGIFVEGTVTHGETRRSPSVPESSVIRMAGGDYVFVSRDDAGTFEARAVRLGRFNGTRYEIADGLSGGENVVVQGVFFLKSALLQSRSED